MLLKNHLIEVFKKASLENNVLLKENIVLKWVHRFGIDSLNDLLIYSQVLKANQYQENNQEKITLIDEENEEENQSEINWESNNLETPSINRIFSRNQDSKKIKQYTNTQKLPLPYIENLRRWINNDKKAS